MAFNPRERRRRNSIPDRPDFSRDPPLYRTDSDSELRMVLLGKTGSGKSSTGNTILGEEAFEVTSPFQGGTKDSVKVYSTFDGRSFCVIDTPGLLNPGMSNDEVKDQIEEAVDLAFPGPHVFLLVMRLDVRFTAEERNTVKWILENFGEEIQKHTIVLFTHGNVLKERTIEEYLGLNPELKRVVASMADYHVFENENEDDETQVLELLEKIDKVVEKKGRKKTYEKHKKTSEEENTFTQHAKTVGVLGVAATGMAVVAKFGVPLGIPGAVAVAAAALAAGAILWIKKKRSSHGEMLQ